MRRYFAHGAVCRTCETAELSHFDLPPHGVFTAPWVVYRPMKKLLPHEGIIGKRQGGHRMVRGLPHGGGAIGRSIWHPLAGIWHIGPHPQKANGPWNYSKGHLRLIAPEHYSSKINLRMRRPPFEAEGALKYVEC